MEPCQNSSIIEFHIIAFTSTQAEKNVLFFVFLLMYMTSVAGNLVIATLICTVSHLHTAMYFFLCNFSIIEATYVSTVLPKLLDVILSEEKKFSFQGCMTQLYFFIFSGDAEFLLLTCMAYDRYVAVCSPLHYESVMRKSICAFLAGSCLVFSAVNALTFTLLTSTLSFCNSYYINNFFCDLKSLMALSHSDTTSREVGLIVEVICLVFVTFILILTSYIYIISAILRIQSSKGRYKAFSSCSSHLITVVLFYGPITVLYTKPQSKQSEDIDKLLSLLYVVVVPTLNPFVYTLRNKDVIGAIKKVTHFKWKKTKCDSFTKVLK